jgi:hypothetical protein
MNTTAVTVTPIVNTDLHVGVLDSGFRIQDSGFRIQGSGF